MTAYEGGAMPHTLTQTPVPSHDQIATARGHAAHALAQGLDHLRRAAVCFDTALVHMRNGEMPTRGSSTTVAASIDTLRDQIDFIAREESFLVALAEEARRRADE